MLISFHSSLGQFVSLLIPLGLLLTTMLLITLFVTKSVYSIANSNSKILILIKFIITPSSRLIKSSLLCLIVKYPIIICNIFQVSHSNIEQPFHNKYLQEMLNNHIPLCINHHQKMTIIAIHLISIIRLEPLKVT
ncbi:unnamed protein product [Paramecium octaurelia]|uniref:Uncharacterized protein n=1 Tax=Paramecium octaurelia TaxID=43137 RepID=A0A8S1VSW6_PAROT|nr:unnamed protein product [Paramecium octaurelia]